MDPMNKEMEKQQEEPRYLNFPHLPDDATRDGKPALNKYSTTITKDHDFPGAQVCQVQEAFTR
jgi:dihydroxy-acid dehydratase